jgi:hypothetical protein
VGEGEGDDFQGKRRRAALKSISSQGIDSCCCSREFVRYACVCAYYAFEVIISSTLTLSVGGTAALAD